jgi:archaellum component FlaC
MVNEPENLVLRQLHSMDGKLDRILDDVHDLKIRMTSVEEGLSGVHRRLDRVEQRVDRIEMRLDLVTP